MERSLKARSPGGPPSLAQAQARFNVQGCAESNPASNDSVHPEHFELRWVLQPIVDSRNPRAICAEALVRATRMDDGSGQPVVTQDMIVAMERAGTIQELDQWMLLSVLNWIESNLSQFCTPIGFFSINISARTLSDHPVALRMVDDFSSYPLDVRQKVCLEITETAKIEDIEQAGRIIGSLKALGAQVALDDFGEGYATKETLARLPVDLLKLSRRYSHEVSNADGYERVRSPALAGWLANRRFMLC